MTDTRDRASGGKDGDGPPAASPSARDEGAAAFTAARASSGSWAPFLLKLAISLALIGFILWRAELEAVLTALAGADLRWVVPALALQFIGAGLIAARWQGLLAARGVVASWPYLYASTIISNFFRQFLPSILGGDVVRGYDAWRAGASVGLAFMSLVLDRLFGLLALALLASAVLVLLRDTTAHLPTSEAYLAGALLILAALAVLILQILLPSRGVVRLARAGLGLVPGAIRPRIEKIAAALGNYRDAPGVLVRSLALSLVLQTIVITFYWMLAMGLDLSVDYTVFFVVVPVAFIVMLLPITVNGIGLREGVFVFLLAPWGVDAADAVAFAWLEYGTTLVFGLLAGLLYMLRKR